MRRAGDRGDARVVIRTVAAPVRRVESVLRALSSAGSGASCLFDPPAGPAFAGCGVAASLVGGTLGQAPGRAERLWQRIVVTSDVEPPAPRMFGAVGFWPGQSPGAPSEIAFVLPRLLYTLDGERARLSLARSSDEDKASARELEEALGRIERVIDPLPAAAQAETRTIELSERDWVELVRRALDRIAAGQLEKVVLARRSLVECAAPIDVPAVLAGLRAETGCTRFALSTAGATFMGATPERLIEKRGRAIATEALAGSAQLGSDPRALEDDRKERAEHALVARAIEARLRPLCQSLEVPAGPEVRRLRHGLHLRTPMRGTLAAPGHVLELGAALHPTPATGGVPAAAALEFILASETTPRGLYGGPVGWFDCHGDGELFVGIRSGLVMGRSALVYAGAGIVRGSDPHAEYLETGWKQRAMLRALGALA